MVASESCYNTIKQSWSEIDRVAAETNGLITLANIFTNCSPLNSAGNLKDTITLTCHLRHYDSPPSYPVNKICSAIDGSPAGTDVLGRTAAGVQYFPVHLCFVCFDGSPAGIDVLGRIAAGFQFVFALFVSKDVMVFAVSSYQYCLA